MRDIEGEVEDGSAGEVANAGEHDHLPRPIRVAANR